MPATLDLLGTGLYYQGRWVKDVPPDAPPALLDQQGGTVLLPPPDPPDALGSGAQVLGYVQDGALPPTPNGPPDPTVLPEAAP